MTTPRDPDTPAAMMEHVRALRREADDTEADAIRAALKAHNWRAQPAADALGMPYTSLLQLLKGRHKAIGAQLEKMREKIGGVRRPGTPAK